MAYFVPSICLIYDIRDCDVPPIVVQMSAEEIETLLYGRVREQVCMQ